MDNDIKDSFCKIQYMMSKGFFNGLSSYGINYAVIKGCPLAYYKTGNYPDWSNMRRI